MKTIICFDYENETYYINRKNTYSRNICSKNIQDAFVFTNQITLNNSIDKLIGGICLHIEKPCWEERGCVKSFQ